MFGIMAAQIYGRSFGVATNLYSIWLHEINFCLTSKDLIYNWFIPGSGVIILWGLSVLVFTGTCEIVILMASGHKQLWHHSVINVLLWNSKNDLVFVHNEQWRLPATKLSLRLNTWSAKTLAWLHGWDNDKNANPFVIRQKGILCSRRLHWILGGPKGPPIYLCGL